MFDTGFFYIYKKKIGFVVFFNLFMRLSRSHDLSCEFCELTQVDLPLLPKLHVYHATPG